MQHSVSQLPGDAGGVFWFPELPTKIRRKNPFGDVISTEKQKNWCVCVFRFREAHLSARMTEQDCHVVLMCINCACVFICHADGSLVKPFVLFTKYGFANFPS